MTTSPEESNEDKVLSLLPNLNSPAFDVKLHFGHIHGMTAFHVMVSLGDLYGAKRFLDLGADVSAKTGQWWSELSESDKYRIGIMWRGHKLPTYTALHLAIKCGYKQMVKLLIDYKADVNAEDHNNERPIELAVEFSDSYVTELLIQSGADYNGKHFDDYPLIFRAIERRNEEMVAIFGRLWRSSLYYVNKSPVEYAMTASPDCVPLLISFGLQLHFVNNTTGRTPLQLAISHENIQWIELLCQNECNPNTPGGGHNRALHTAVQFKCNSEILLLLLRHGADPNLKNDLKLTPLSHAIINGHTIAVKILLDYNTILSPQLTELDKSFVCRHYKASVEILKRCKSLANYSAPDRPIWHFGLQCVGDQNSEVEDMVETMKLLVQLSPESDLNYLHPFWGSLLHFLMYSMVCVPTDRYKHLFKVMVQSVKYDINQVFVPKDTQGRDGQLVHAQQIVANGTAISFGFQMNVCGVFVEELIRMGADVKSIDWREIFFAPQNKRAFQMFILSGYLLPDNFRTYADPRDDTSIDPNDQKHYNDEFDSFVEWLDRRQSQPLSLKQSARIVIRNQLGLKGCRQLDAKGVQVFSPQFSTFPIDLSRYILFRSAEDFEV